MKDSSLTAPVQTGIRFAAVSLVFAALVTLTGCAGAGAGAGIWPPPPETRPKVGLALGGGGARGFAEIGVIRTLEREKVPIDIDAITVMAAEIGRLRAREADVVITPNVGDTAYDDFSRKKQLIEAGESAALAALPQIKAAIAAKTRQP